MILFILMSTEIFYIDIKDFKAAIQDLNHNQVHLKTFYKINLII